MRRDGVYIKCRREYLYYWARPGLDSLGRRFEPDVEDLEPIFRVSLA